MGRSKSRPSRSADEAESAIAHSEAQRTQKIASLQPVERDSSCPMRRGPAEAAKPALPRARSHRIRKPAQAISARQWQGATSRLAQRADDEREVSKKRPGVRRPDPNVRLDRRSGASSHAPASFGHAGGARAVPSVQRRDRPSDPRSANVTAETQPTILARDPACPLRPSRPPRDTEAHDGRSGQKQSRSEGPGAKKVCLEPSAGLRGVRDDQRYVELASNPRQIDSIARARKSR